MRKLITLFVALACASVAISQTAGGGSAAFRGGQGNAIDAERAKRNISKDDMPPSKDSQYVDASVLINRKADEYVAVFTISKEGKTLEEARQSMEAAVKGYTAKLDQMGVKPSDIYVDFVSQNRVYGYEINGDNAVEKLVGFEVKKNISIHYKSKEMLDGFIESAAEFEIFDLVKVDYVVKDIAAIQKQLMAEAGKVIRQKIATREALLDVRFLLQKQVYAEKYASYYPVGQYDSYVAQESQNLGGYRNNMMIQQARKPRTAFFNPLGQESFDQVINPVVIEPIVQFTLYLKVKVEAKPPTPAKK